jgi:hypothetical protein
MGRPEDDHLLWDWEVVTTETRQTRHGPRTLEGRVARQPDGWYILATDLTVPQGPFLTYAAAVAAARAAVREGRRR